MSKKVTITEKLNEVNKAIEELGGDEPCYKTDGQIDGCVKIQNDESIESLVRTLASFRVREEAFNKASKELGVDVEFKLNGHSIDDIKEDIKTRIKVVSNKTKLDKLKEAKKELEGLISDEEKRENALSKVDSLLN
jgi:chaperonin cofactor prefoldin